MKLNKVYEIVEEGIINNDKITVAFINNKVKLHYSKSNKLFGLVKTEDAEFVFTTNEAAKKEFDKFVKKNKIKNYEFTFRSNVPIELKETLKGTLGEYKARIEKN